LIAASLFWGGWPARAALIGAIAFLIAITPLGVGSGFPSTVLMAVGCYRLLCSPRALERSLAAIALNRIRPGQRELALTRARARLRELAGRPGPV
jgi:hypothetical protein